MNRWPLRPCDGDREHDWEVVLRCRTCGFQVTAEAHRHPRQPVRDALQRALQNLFRYRRPNATAVVVLLGLALSSPAHGQETAKPVTPSSLTPTVGTPAPKVGIDVTADVGRVYSVPDGRYVIATMPGVEVSYGPLTVSALLALEPGGREIDVGASYARNLRPRITWSVNGNYYRYPGLGQDVTWSTGVRITLR